MPEKTESFKGSIAVAEAESRKMDIDIFKVVQEAWLNKQITFEEYISSIRAGGGEITFGELRVEAPLSKKTTIEGTIQRYKKGELSMHQWRRLIAEQGGEAEFWDFELSKHPDYKAEDSKVGFMWNPFFSHKGIFMQNVTKRAIVAMVNFIYKSCLKYDKDAFAFSDPRLIRLKKYADVFVESYIKVGYKKDLIQKLTSVALFFMKEDVYYRAVTLKMINEAPSDFDISAEEIRYFNRENPSIKEVKE
jgi:hypothetical protein